jgi:hypothetical protein
LSPCSSIDLIVVLLGWFFEQDRAVHFWHADELLRSELPPALERFQQALRDTIAHG